MSARARRDLSDDCGGMSLTCRLRPLSAALASGIVVVVFVGGADLDLGAFVEAVGSGGDDRVGGGEAGEDLDVFGRR